MCTYAGVGCKLCETATATPETYAKGEACKAEVLTTTLHPYNPAQELSRMFEYIGTIPSTDPFKSGPASIACREFTGVIFTPLLVNWRWRITSSQCHSHKGGKIG